MVGDDKVEVRLLQGQERLLLIVKHVPCQSCVHLWVVQSSSLELTTLVMLHQMVVGVPREGKWVEEQRIHRGKLEQAQRRVRRNKVNLIEADQVMAEKEADPSANLSSLSSAVSRLPF